MERKILVLALLLILATPAISFASTDESNNNLDNKICIVGGTLVKSAVQQTLFTIGSQFLGKYVGAPVSTFIPGGITPTYFNPTPTPAPATTTPTTTTPTTPTTTTTTPVVNTTPAAPATPAAAPTTPATTPQAAPNGQPTEKMIPVS